MEFQVPGLSVEAIGGANKSEKDQCLHEVLYTNSQPQYEEWRFWVAVERAEQGGVA